MTIRERSMKLAERLKDLIERQSCEIRKSREQEDEIQEIRKLLRSANE